MAGLVRGPITINHAAKIRRVFPVQDLPKLTRKVPVAPATRTPVRSAPPAVKAKPAGPSAADLARQAEQRAAAERSAAAARARATANNQAKTQAQQEIDRYNAEITANAAKKLTNQTSLEALKKLVTSGPGSHSSVRDNALATLDKALREKLAQIDLTFTEAIGDFRENLRDNEASEADSSFANLGNRARERQDLTAQALSQGAGESDLLRTQLQALRNWSANQADINRSFFDTRASINSGITDLNASTKTGRLNEELTTNAAKGSTWSDFYESMNKTYSDMANFDQQIYLLDAENQAIEKQKATATGLLDWLAAGKNAEDYTPKTGETKAAAPPAYTSDYARRAAEMAGAVWKDPGVSEATKNWQGAAQSTGSLNTAALWNAPENTGVDGAKKPKRPEGATLRRW